MECPHCHKEIPGRDCTHCGALIPLKSHYCMHCGINLEEEVGDSIAQDEEFDLESRVLCPDGTCTGIIIDGQCTECGRLHSESEVKEE